MNRDINLVVIAGRIAAPPELRSFESGTEYLRYLVTTVNEVPRHRVDVIPVTLWNPDARLVDAPGTPGERVWAVAAVQRRFMETDDGRRTRIELVAHHVNVGEPDLRPDA